VVSEPVGAGRVTRTLAEVLQDVVKLVTATQPDRPFWVGTASTEVLQDVVKLVSATQPGRPFWVGTASTEVL